MQHKQAPTVREFTVSLFYRSAENQKRSAGQPVESPKATVVLSIVYCRVTRYSKSHSNYVMLSCGRSQDKARIFMYFDQSGLFNLLARCELRLHRSVKSEALQQG